MSFKYYILLPIVWVCLCFPSDAFGQYIKKETVNSQVYAVIYAEGLAGSAQWVSGFKMMKNHPSPGIPWKWWESDCQ